MPNLSLNNDRVVKGELKDGEIIKFVNEGDILEVDFSKGQLEDFLHAKALWEWSKRKGD